MSKYCPILNRKVVYLDCLECDEKICQKETMDQSKTNHIGVKRPVESFYKKGKCKGDCIMKKIVSLFSVIALVFSLCAMGGCAEAEKVNYNIAKQATYFGCERRVTVYNARTDKIIMEIEGYINIENNSSGELVVTAKVGADSYKVNYVYLNDYTLYVVEDINGTHTDPYHYKVYFHTEIVPDVELKP